MFDSIADLRDAGFEGFRSIHTLRTLGRDVVPEAPGVYLVVQPDGFDPEIRPVSRAGRFKGCDPTISANELRSKRPQEHLVVYFGASVDLRRRVAAFLRFGAGKAAAHWGGRSIWQLANADDLLLAWRVENRRDPEKVKKGMIAEFKARFGTLPFANLRS